MYNYEDYNSLYLKNDNIMKSIDIYEDNEIKYEIHSFFYRNINNGMFIQEPIIRECRGISFIIDPVGNKRIFTLSHYKFFNYGETEETLPKNIDKLKPVKVMNKLDGSSISFGYIKTFKGIDIIPKFKTGIYTEQCNMVNEFIEKHHGYYNFIYDCLIEKNICPIFEYIGPDNQVIIRYDKSELILTGLRCLKTGKYYHKVSDLMRDIEFTSLFDVDEVEEYNITTLDEIKEIYKSKDNVEGYVVVFENNQMVKFKTDDYVSLHEIKDNININKNLTLLILNDRIDDIISRFPQQREFIEKKQKLINDKYLNMVNTVTSFYNNHKDLDRKLYVIESKKQVNEYFYLTILLYDNKEPDYIEFFIKNKMYKEFFN